MNILDAINQGFNTLRNVVNDIRNTEENARYTMQDTQNMIQETPGVPHYTTTYTNQSPANIEYSTNYNALKKTDEKLQNILPEEQSNKGLYEKLSRLHQDIEKVLQHPNPAAVNGMAKELGVGTFSNAPGFHLNGYLNNLQAKIDSKPINDAQSVISSLEK
mgnify:CR=1 FL=1